MHSSRMVGRWDHTLVSTAPRLPQGNPPLKHPSHRQANPPHCPRPCPFPHTPRPYMQHRVTSQAAPVGFRRQRGAHISLGGPRGLLLRQRHPTVHGKGRKLQPHTAACRSHNLQHSAQWQASGHTGGVPVTIAGGRRGGRPGRTQGPQGPAPHVGWMCCLSRPAATLLLCF